MNKVILILSIVVLITVAIIFLVKSYKIINYNSQIRSIERSYRNVREIDFTYLQNKIEKSDWEKEGEYEAFK